jgi:hypothetical protein
MVTDGKSRRELYGGGEFLPSESNINFQLCSKRFVDIEEHGRRIQTCHFRFHIQKLHRNQSSSVSLRELNAFQYHAKPVPYNQPHYEPYPLYPLYFQVPSRQYSLGEEQVFATFPLAGCECMFEIKSNKDGRSIGDKWSSWGDRWKPRLRADKEKTLVNACSYIYNTEMTRPDRFFSWEEKPVEVESSKSEPLIQVEH